MRKTLLTIIACAASVSMAAEETVIFQDDFEWLEPWSAAANAGNSVETDDLNATAPALTSLKTEIDGTEITCFQFVESKGYKFVYDKNDNKRIYLQRNCLKFGKTGNHGGIILPAVDNIPAGTTPVLTFDWSPMRQGTGKIDPVNLYVLVENGEDSKQFDIPECGWENGHKLEWIPAKVELTGVTINKDTKITIRQTQWEVGTANRWFLDNLKLAAVDAAGIDGIVVDDQAPVEYYNLQGIRVAEPTNGLYIRRQGKKATKVVIGK